LCFFEGVLNSAARTDRLAHLMSLVIWAWVLTVLGIVVIVELTANSASWWTIVASSLGGVAAERAGVAFIRRRHQRRHGHMKDSKGQL
jgi:membrane protein DedA with SNARE-associated domain